MITIDVDATEQPMPRIRGKFAVRSWGEALFIDGDGRRRMVGTATLLLPRTGVVQVGCERIGNILRLYAFPEELLD